MDRAEAKSVNVAGRKFRLSKVLIISTPTAPVAPTTATCCLRFMIKRTQIYRPGNLCQPPGGNAGNANEVGRCDKISGHWHAALLAARSKVSQPQKMMQHSTWRKMSRSTQDPNSNRMRIVERSRKFLHFAGI